jgi:hypothetical protein
MKFSEMLEKGMRDPMFKYQIKGHYCDEKGGFCAIACAMLADAGAQLAAEWAAVAATRASRESSMVSPLSYGVIYLNDKLGWTIPQIIEECRKFGH